MANSRAGRTNKVMQKARKSNSSRNRGSSNVSR